MTPPPPFIYTFPEKRKETDTGAYIAEVVKLMD
jgi:hypothetical protein